MISALTTSTPPCRRYPSLDLAEMVIIARYPGASPRDVGLNVTNRLRDARCDRAVTPE